MNKTNKRLAVLTIMGSVALAACGSKTDANERNFSATLDKYLEKEGDQCLELGPWPVDVAKEESKRDLIGLNSPEPSSMKVLEAEGLVKGEDIEAEPKARSWGFSGDETTKIKMRRYTPTDAAKPFIREIEKDSFFSGHSKMNKLCWAKKTLDEVVKWKGPMSLGEYQEVQVFYTYELEDVADWARKPEIQKAFSEVKSTLEGEGRKEEPLILHLTSEGWEAGR